MRYDENINTANKTGKQFTRIMSKTRASQYLGLCFFHYHYLGALRLVGSQSSD